jgi:hypothetical protein
MSLADCLTSNKILNDKYCSALNGKYSNNKHYISVLYFQNLFLKKILCYVITHILCPAVFFLSLMIVGCMIKIKLTEQIIW